MIPSAIIRPDILSPLEDWLVCGMTTRTAPGADAERLALAGAVPALVGHPGSAIVVGSQVHGARVALAVGESGAPAGWNVGCWPAPPCPKGACLREVQGVDGIVTGEPGVLVGVFTADCVPVLLVDPARRLIAAVHAGREGSRQGIAREAVECLVQLGARPQDLLAWIAPCISIRCYEVDADMARDFAEFLGQAAEGTVGGPDGRHLDLREANHRTLISAGLSPGNIEIDPRCTCEDAELFYSYRRDGGLAGRMFTFAMIVA